MTITRPEDQLKRMLEQTLVPPTSVTELDQDTIDQTTSRLGSMTGNLAEQYLLNSQHTPGSLRRLPDAESRRTIRTFYFTTTADGYQRLCDQGSRWALQASQLPERFQRLLSPLWSDPVVVDSLYSVDVLVLVDGALWRSVPGTPGFMLELSWGKEQTDLLAEALPEVALDAVDGVIFLVGHVARSSYVAGDRAARMLGLTAGVVMGALFSAGRAPEAAIGVRIFDQFLDAPVNRAVAADGVERSVLSVLSLTALPQSDAAPESENAPQQADAPAPQQADAPQLAQPLAAPSFPIPDAVVDQWRKLDDEGRKAVEETLAAAVDTVESTRQATLGRVLHRVFERSVSEFFTGEPMSTQLPDELIKYTQPDPEGIVLPDVLPVADISFADVLAERRSTRSYERGPLELDDLARVLRQAAGMTDREDGYGVRDLPKFSYPSIGGLDSNELGLMIFNVDGVEPGYYTYDKVGHALVPRLRGDLRLSLVNATFESEWLFYAPVVMTLVNDQRKVAWKYKTRGYRISHLDQGALMQNLALSAAAHGLGSCPVAGYFDEVLNRVLGYEDIDAFVSALLAIGRTSRLSHGG